MDAPSRHAAATSKQPAAEQPDVEPPDVEPLAGEAREPTAGHKPTAPSSNGGSEARKPIEGFDDESVELAAEALLREHPDAMVCGLAGNGLIVPLPGSVPLWGQSAIEGRALIDSVLAADRKTVLELWRRVLLNGEPASQGNVRLLSKPSHWMTLHFIDTRDTHGVLLGVVIPSDELAQDEGEEDELPPAAPRFSTLIEDEHAKVVEVDDAFTQMFGYTREELVGKAVLDQIHPDDQGRAVEGWLAMLSTRRAQQTRLRRRRKSGGWIWVDTTLHNFLNQPDANHVLIEIIDISAEMAAQEALQEREELLRRLTDGMPVGLFQLDTDRKVVYNNARLLDIVHGSPYAGTAEGELAGPSHSASGDAHCPPARALLTTLTEEGMAAFEAALARVLDEGVDQDVEVDLVLPPVTWRRALMSIRALLRPSGEVGGAITCVLDITDSARARRELEKRATFDALTRCLNRQSILGGLQHELEREDETNTAVVYVDLDKFKPVNDTLGHAAGDEVLVQVADQLRIASRSDDAVGRLGGDEFLVLLRSIPGPDAAMQVAQRICDSLCTTFQLSNGPVELSASIGVAWTNGGTPTADELVKRADAAMYESKEHRDGQPVLAGD
ncbi:MAG TPA: diguanylate cyclase [Solirubrobacteraceae bacterium]|nr:diguanylate cyclase [Solirubrobacteraceae bacterium]